ncbi:hypothetical protein [Brevundimonas balnearis]|uniref:Uncharacterized protein n=1 Tax=Brevundimonas balnearis TaxID=1572858 RepID=A0ABV6R0W2_9CAUL
MSAITVKPGAGPVPYIGRYQVVEGRIVNASGQVFSVPMAQRRIADIAADIARVEATYGQSDPDTADILQDMNLQAIRALRACIKAVREYEPEPHVLRSPGSGAGVSEQGRAA